MNDQSWSLSWIKRERVKHWASVDFTCQGSDRIAGFRLQVGGAWEDWRVVETGSLKHCGGVRLSVLPALVIWTIGHRLQATSAQYFNCFPYHGSSHLFIRPQPYWPVCLFLELTTFWPLLGPWPHPLFPSEPPVSKSLTTSKKVSHVFSDAPASSCFRSVPCLTHVHMCTYTFMHTACMQAHTNICTYVCFFISLWLYLNHL